MTLSIVHGILEKPYEMTEQIPYSKRDIFDQYESTSSESSHSSLTGEILQRFIVHSILEKPYEMTEQILYSKRDIFDQYESTSSELSHSSLTGEILQRFSELQKIGIELRNNLLLIQYLLSHSDILEVLTQMCIAVADQFKKDSEICVFTTNDPEENYEFIKINVRKKEYPPDFLSQLKSLDREFLPLLRKKSGQILLTTDFQPIENDGI